MKVQYDKDIRQQAKKEKTGLMTVQVRLPDGSAVTVQGTYSIATCNEVLDFVYKKTAEDNK